VGDSAACDDECPTKTGAMMSRTRWTFVMNCLRRARRRLSHDRALAVGRVPVDRLLQQLAGDALQTCGFEALA